VAQAAPGAPAQGGDPQLPQLVYSSWAKYCGRENTREVCLTGKDGRTEAGQPVVAGVLIETAGDPKKIFRVTLPSPLQLQFGTRLIIDGDKPISAAFTSCYANGCMVDYEATSELLTKLKNGQTLQVQAINLNANAISFPLPLSDTSGNSFRRANEGLPVTNPKAFEEQQKKLQANVQTPSGSSGQGGEIHPRNIQTPQLVYSPWAKFCGKGQDANAKEVCFTGKDGRTEAGQPVVAAALIEPSGEQKKLFRVTLPNTVQLQYGTRLIIDRDQPISGAFFTCFANGCMADYEATPELVAKLKRGQAMQIQAINQAGDAAAYSLPLADLSGNSFRKANDGPPTDPKVFEEQQKKLQEDLQKRAEEIRKKSEQR
jgi:invasion protein IalB